MDEQPVTQELGNAGSGSNSLSPNRLARSDVFPNLAVAHNERASDHYIAEAIGVLRRVFVGGLVDNSRAPPDTLNN